MPANLTPFPLSDIGKHNWNVLREDLPFPLAVLKDSALRHNSAWMKQFVQSAGAQISPHGKTTMSPQLFDLQLADGAWAVTVSTPHHIHIARAFGYKRIFLANQLLGRKSIEFVLQELKDNQDFEFYCLVDSVESVDILAKAAQAMNIGRRLCVLLEGGYLGGRTGCRSLAHAMQTARAVKQASPHLALVGIEGFEGLIREPTPAESITKIEVFLDFLIEIAQSCLSEELFSDGPLLISAGGSSYYDIVSRKLSAQNLGVQVLPILRSGCYLTHDSIMYKDSDAALRKRTPSVERIGDGLQPAIEVWAYVQSRPEPETIIVTMGKRDVSPDHPPVALRWFRPGASMVGPIDVPTGHTVVRLNDQHAKLVVPSDTPLAVGDLVAFGIGHPCLTFDKWRVMTVVNDQYDVVSAIRTYF
ncbi:amino acid deaminase [Achromobacter xylosoxidans]|uniref:amino acid deaminase n=1 Tax=Alcaligenes xylosoxydans xylosoxydans TaxID=85698 RepID=UPI001F139D73|nr:amino acid deaminase [Achromobacter xylosoxidans]